MKPNYEASGFKKLFEDMQVVREDDSPMNRKNKRALNMKKSNIETKLNDKQDANQDIQGQTQTASLPAIGRSQKKSLTLTA